VFEVWHVAPVAWERKPPLGTMWRTPAPAPALAAVPGPWPPALGGPATPAAAGAHTGKSRAALLVWLTADAKVEGVGSRSEEGTARDMPLEVPRCGEAPNVVHGAGLLGSCGVVVAVVVVARPVVVAVELPPPPARVVLGTAGADADSWGASGSAA
jgi:hypothetical protein